MLAPTDYLEAVLVWSLVPDAAADTWLRARGLDTLPMQSGLLVTGTREVFDRAFGVELEHATFPVSLPLPSALQGSVRLIRIRALPTPHQSS